MENSPYFLIYASTAAWDFTEAELLELLTLARDFNASRDITGLLLYSPGQGTEKGTFVQTLEGPRAVVQALYVKISQDRRHSDCTVLNEGTLFRRRFSDWTMGFRNLASVRPEEVPGFNPIFLRGLTLRTVLEQKDPVVQLLYSFAGS